MSLELTTLSRPQSGGNDQAVLVVTRYESAVTAGTDQVQVKPGTVRRFQMQAPVTVAMTRP